VFFVLSAVLALATAGLLFELIANPRTREPGHPGERRAASSPITRRC
jgi:hypothetical protein